MGFYLRKFFYDDNRGIGVVEMILILLVLVGLVVIFKGKIGGIVSKALTSITSKVNTL